MTYMTFHKRCPGLIAPLPISAVQIANILKGKSRKLAFLVPYSFHLFPYHNVHDEDEVDVESGP